VPNCECGCGQQAKNRFIRGHQLHRQIPIEVSRTVAETALLSAKRPPPYPAPFDRRLFRLAAEREGTSRDADWQEMRCLECHEIAWTRDPKADLCEDCLWGLMEKLGDETVKQHQLMARQPYNPFES